MTRIPSFLCLAAALVVLAGCGGGGGGDAAPAADPLAMVPEAATQSVGGTLDYLVLLSQNTSETRDAIDVSAIMLPTSETAEPQLLN